MRTWGVGGRSGDGLKIEKDRFYKTRVGLKAIVYAVYEDHIHGAILRDPEPQLQLWWSGGHVCFNKTESVFDIVSEWEEPKSKLKAWLNEEGQQYRLMFVEEGNEAPVGWFRADWLDER